MADISTAIGLFNFAIDCFGRIQIARGFEDDFAIYQLKLDILQLRLSRWGVVVGINDSSNSIIKDDTTDVTSPAGILKSIKKFLDRAQRDGDNKLNPGDKPFDSDSDMPDDLKGIRTKFKECLKKRVMRAEIAVESLKWAFYKKAKLEEFIGNITSLITALEAQLSPDLEAKLRELSKEECTGIDKPDLQELRGIVEESDPWLQKAVGEQLEHVPGGASYNINQSHIKGTATGVHYGDVMGVSNGDGNSTKNYWGRK
ncbi:prion-inhibition and propagation-domain-containing protein [Phyllosticta capitalensis]|uniref:Prion-inhibition and propagation-domain-containing protein n=1 Tax=Phyllosticta capitalensis TaxID=121624 RepID=A0ABR1Z0B9_9PEZI